MAIYIPTIYAQHTLYALICFKPNADVGVTVVYEVNCVCAV